MLRNVLPIYVLISCVKNRPNTEAVIKLLNLTLVNYKERKKFKDTVMHMDTDLQQTLHSVIQMELVLIWSKRSHEIP